MPGKNLICGDISGDELMFFDRSPRMLPVYERLRAKLAEAHPEVSIKVTKTQISFKNRYIFALASFARVPRAPKEYLLVTFGLDYQKCAPRIAVSTQAAPNRWTHHVVVQSQREIDEELLAWIEEAYRFSNRK